jgi:Sulfatase
VHETKQAETAPASAHAITPEAAVILAWLLVSIVNVVFISLEPLPIMGPTDRAWHLTFEIGQNLAVGIACAAGLVAWQRFGARYAKWGWALLALLSVVIGLLSLSEDLAGLTSKLLGGPSRWGALGISALAALVVPVGAVAGKLLCWPWLRWLVVGGGAGLLVMNNVLLPGDYAGVHLVASLAAVAAITTALTSTSIPACLAGIRRTRPARILIAAIALAALALVLAKPSHRVRVQMLRIDGAIIAPVIARGHTLMSRFFPTSAAAQGQGQWMKSRRDAPDVPPSNLGLVDSRNLILVMVTLDSVRDELFTDPKYEERLPRLRALARDSVYFSQTKSIGSGTGSTFRQVFSGKHIFQCKEPTTTFAEILTKAGIPTVTFAVFPRLLPKHGLTKGIREAHFVRPVTKGQKFALAKPTIDAAIRRINKHDGGPLFLFIHLLDPHSPYDAAGKKATPFDSCVEETALCGVAIERLIDALKKKGFWDRTVLISGADHGEGFNKHKGLPHHNNGLYEEIVHVPLFFRIPGMRGKEIDTWISSIDLGPTILDLFGLPTPGEFMGQSLLPLIGGLDVELTRPILSNTRIPVNKTALYKQPFKLIVNNRNDVAEVYNLETDPDERNNLADSMADDLLAELNAFRNVHRVR